MTSKIINPLLALTVGGLILAGSAAAQSGATTPSSTSAPVTSAQQPAGTVSTSAPPTDAGAGQHQQDHPWANQVNQRETREQNRINSGLKNGSLTPQQAAQAQQREAQIVNQEKRDEAANHGHLTKAERKQLNQEQSRLASKTYREEHPKKKK
jgi:hypothetical protein